MGFFGSGYDVDSAQGAVDSAQRRLDAAKANLATAKSNGNYKRATKNISYNGKKGNNYDYAVWQAQENLAEMKKRLADAKVKAREAKAKEAKEAREAKAKEAREAREARESRSSSRSSSSSRNSSSSRSSSSSRDSYDSYDDNSDEEETVNDWRDEVDAAVVVPFRNHLNSKYSISSVDSFKAIVLVRAELYLEREAVKTRYADVDVSESVKNYVTKKCLSVVDELMDEASEKYRKLSVLQYANSLNEKYPIAKSTDAQLAQWLPELLEEMNTQKRELRAKDSDEERDIIRGYIREVKNLGISAYERLEKLNKKLFKSPEIQAVVQEIDPSYEPPSIFGKLGSLFDFGDFSNAMDRVKSSFSDMFNTNIFKK